MARVVVAATARADLSDLILTHNLPPSTRERVRASIAALARFPLLGPSLVGRWSAFRFVLAPWPWLILVHAYDRELDQVVVVTIQDSRSARAATAER